MTTTATLITIISKLMENVHDGKNPPMLLLENDAGRKWIAMLCSDGKCAQMQSGPRMSGNRKNNPGSSSQFSKMGIYCMAKKGRETHSEIPMNESKQK